VKTREDLNLVVHALRPRLEALVASLRGRGVRPTEA